MSGRKVMIEKAEDLLREADHLDNKAQDWERLASECITEKTRRRCLWDANQCRGAAVRRWKEAQAILNPVTEVAVTVGGVDVTEDELDEYSEFEIPDRIKVLLGADAERLV